MTQFLLLTPPHSAVRLGAFGLVLAGSLFLAGCCCCRAPSAKGSPAAPVFVAGKATPLFDGRTLRGWKETDFAGKGETVVKDGQIRLGMGYMTGITWTNDLPRMNYEIRLEAMRVDGSDFFCGLTFPVGEDPCSFIVGGWGGGVVGLSSIDGEDAANNETTSYLSFESGRWYAVRVRVTPGKIEAWIDGERVVEQETTDRKVDIRIEMEESRPLGIATYATTAALRNLAIEPLKE